MKNEKRKTKSEKFYQHFKHWLLNFITITTNIRRINKI
jgi:hypothetical protein